MNNELIKYIQLLSGRDTKTLEGRALKTSEESGEMAKKVLAHSQSSGSLHRFVTSACVLEECADVMLCAMSAAYHLGFSQEDLETMMMQKAQKWDLIQQREIKSTFPLPFEIHITVQDAKTDDFKAACTALGVKPIFLALQNREGNTRMHDVMTSSVHLGDNSSAQQEMQRIADGLTSEGFKVVRKKIETVPWHPAAPSEETGVKTIPAGCYFESHLNILVTSKMSSAGNEREALSVLATHHNAHLSKNVFKQHTETEYTIMMTLRSYIVQRETFERMRDNLVEDIKHFGFEIEKVITEFAVYDSKNDHDSAWLSVK